MSQHKDKVAWSIRALERIHSDMGEIATRRDTNWKFDMVQKRREQSQQLATLAQDLTAWLAELPDQEVSRKTQALFSEMRHTISMTQTQWPLSLIDTPGALQAYGKAAGETIRTSGEFFGWTKPLLDMR